MNEVIVRCLLIGMKFSWVGQSFLWAMSPLHCSLTSISRLKGFRLLPPLSQDSRSPRHQDKWTKWVISSLTKLVRRWSQKMTFVWVHRWQETLDRSRLQLKCLIAWKKSCVSYMDSAIKLKTSPSVRDKNGKTSVVTMKPLGVSWLRLSIKTSTRKSLPLRCKLRVIQPSLSTRTWPFLKIVPCRFKHMVLNNIKSVSTKMLITSRIVLAWCYSNNLMANIGSILKLMLVSVILSSITLMGSSMRAFRTICVCLILNWTTLSMPLVSS